MASGSEQYKGVNMARSTKASKRSNNTPKWKPGDTPF